MATATHTSTNEANAAALPALFRIPRAMYGRMVDAGVFEGARLYLWEGLLVEKMSKGRPHVFAVNSLLNQFGQLLPPGWFVEQEQPMDVGPDSVPEPDLKIVRGAFRDYLRRPPNMADVPLIAEVSDSSVSFDLGPKLKAYAQDGVPAYWVVNLPEERVEVYTGPSGPIEPSGYRARQIYMVGDEIPLVLDGHEVGRVAVRDILP